MVKSVTAQDAGNQIGLGIGDKVTVVFDKLTNTPNVTDKTNLDRLLTFSADLGSAYSGNWTDRKTLVVTIEDATGAAAAKDVAPGCVDAGCEGHPAVYALPTCRPRTARLRRCWPGRGGAFPAPAIRYAKAVDKCDVEMFAGASIVATFHKACAGYISFEPRAVVSSDAAQCDLTSLGIRWCASSECRAGRCPIPA